MTRLQKTLFITLVASLALLSGCISLVPTPHAARSGDVINIGLGGVKRNAGGQLVLANDLTISITDANQVVHTPQIQGVYRVYPDHTSMYAVTVQNRNHVNFGDLDPNDGAVWVTIKLTDSANAPLPLAVGPASISVSSPKLTQTSKSGRPEGVYSDFAMEILPGVGTLSMADQQNFAYQTEGFLSVKPSATAPVTVGGAQFEFIFDASLSDGQPFELSLVPQHHDPNAKLIQSVKDNGDGTKTLKAALTNPAGFAVTLNDWSQGMSSLYDLNLAIVGNNGGAAWIANADIGNYFTVTANSFYVDVNGEVIPGIVPVISNEFY